MRRLNNKRVPIIQKAGILLLWVIFSSPCINPGKRYSIITGPDTASHVLPLNHDKDPGKIQTFHPAAGINTGQTTAAELVDFAKTLIGIPYLYASTNPARGFDCSGFITYVFNHFDIPVPRSSVDFTGMGKEIEESDSRPGDIILFTGTDSTIRVVGHMGIVTSNEEGLLEFIHSTSGKLKGVVITPLKDYYRSRFVKIIRVFPG
jgi:cell wall-associated NlpC family hydrolase